MMFVEYFGNPGGWGGEVGGIVSSSGQGIEG